MTRFLGCCLGVVLALARGEEALGIPRASHAPVVDGNLESGIWDDALELPTLSPARGVEEEIPVQKSTSVRFLWDPEALYVAFSCHDDRIRTSEAYERDGDIYEKDVVEVFLHAEGAPVPYYELVVSPLNQVLDAAHFLTAPKQENENGILPDPFLKRHFWTFRSWNWEGLQTATSRRREGDGWVWTVEMRIPVYKLLRHDAREKFRAGDLLRSNILRYDWTESDKEKTVLRQANWQPVLTGCPHISPGAMGLLRLQESRQTPAVGSFPEVDSLLLRYEADHPANEVHRHQAEFGPGDVDIHANVLHVEGISFPFRRPSIRAGGVNPNLLPVYFEETTGTGNLPVPLRPDTPYYAVDDLKGGLAVYPFGTDAHAGITLIGDGHHRVLEADPAVQDVGRILFTDSGSGRFRIHTGRTVSRLADLVHDTYHLTATGVGGIGREFELLREDGTDLLFHRGAITSLANMNDHSYHGKFMVPAGDQQALKAHFAGNNTLYQIFVGEVPVYRRRYKSNSRLFTAGDRKAIDPAANTLQLDSTRGLASIEPVRVYSGERGKVPSGLQEDTRYFARLFDDQSAALYRNIGDAQRDTGRLEFTDTGKGVWSLVFTQRAADSPKNEYIGLDVSRPDHFNTHDLVLQLKNTAASGFHGLVRPDRVKTGPGSAIRKEYPGGTPLVAWMPVDTIAPAFEASSRLWKPGDPEPQLQKGRVEHGRVYHTSRSGNARSPYLRLHRTREQAEFCAGLSGTDERVVHNAIRFTSQGEGEWTLYPDEASNVSTFNVSGHGRLSEGEPVIPAGELSVFVFALDRNGEGEENRVYYYARNPVAPGLSTYHRFESRIPKGPFGPATDHSSTVLLGNSAQAHVPGRFKLYAVLLGTDGPDGRLPMEEIHQMVMYYKSRLGIP